MATLAPDALILAIDVGTSSIRVMIFDRKGRALDGVFAQIKYSPDTTHDGGWTVDANAMCSRIYECIDTALEQAEERAERIALVGMDTLVGNVLGIDANGQPTTPMYTWADVRGADLADGWRAKLAAAGVSVAEYTRRTGCRIHTSYWPLRLLWIEATEPDSFKRATHWLSIGEYALYRLFGERRVSLSAASWSGLLNRHKLDWDDDVLSTLPIHRDQLSTPGAHSFHGLTGQWAERWPALKNAVWLPPVGDGVASNIGAGCTSPQHVALSVGTSGALRVVVPGSPAEVPDGLFSYRVDAKRTLVGGPLSNAGNLYAWLHRVLNTDDTPDLMDAVGKLAPDSHGLTILPFLAGERAPGWNDRTRAVFMGMTFDTAPEHLIRAGMEAIAYRFSQVARRLAPLLPSDAVYVASGAGMINSPTWMQIMADVLNAPVFATTEAETTIRGTVFLATGEEFPPRLGQSYTPNLANRATYQAAVARQQALYERLFG